MVSVLFLVVVVLSLDWAKKCKGVNYNYKAFGGVKDYGYGCKFGCFGYYNGSSDEIDSDGRKIVDDHTEQSECAECKTITAELAGGSADGAKEWCMSTGGGMSTGGCHWKKGKCVSSSCYTGAAMQKCNSRFGHEWADGKCKKVKGDKCEAYGYTRDVYKAGPVTTSGNDLEVEGALCKDLASYFESYSQDYNSATYTWSYTGRDPYTEDDVKKCKFYCEHPEHTYYAGGPWDYTRETRKYCHRVYGCMFSGEQGCSALAIWAFVLILVIAILVFLAIIGVIFFLIFKLCCGKSTKVDPAPAPQAAAKSAHAPATQVPLFEVGPYVVIKVGKQESKTKKVESAVWGQAIIFNGMGAEDDDVVFELHDNNDALLGTADVRIPDYVNAKKRATINLKNGEADIGVLEVDIEIQVQEEPEVKITGVFYVDKFAKV